MHPRSFLAGGVLGPLAVLGFSGVLSAQEPPASPTADDPAALLQEVLDLCQQRALRTAEVDWSKLRAEAEQRTQKSHKHADVYPTIRWILRELGDGHSFFMTPEQVQAWQAPPPEPASEGEDDETEADPQEAARFVLPEGELLEGDIGHLRIPSCGSTNAEFIQDFAQTLQDVIRDIEEEVPIGWVVDLRGNTGGNCWPMLAGVSSVLGEGKAGSFQGADQDAAYGVANGRSWSGTPEGVVVAVERPAALDEARPWVAVLTDRRTASSGEVLTVAFRARPRTRSFGEATAGLSTANTSCLLRDGSMILLTTSVYADRTGHRYGERIVPDEPIAIPEPRAGQVEAAEDLVLLRAVQWLRTAYENDGRP